MCTQLEGALQPASKPLAALQVYLIEVNSCPALSLRGAVLQDLLPRVMEEAVQKAIDPLFPVPPRTTPASSDEPPADAQHARAPPAKLSGFVPLPLVAAPRRSLAERSSSMPTSRTSSVTERLAGARHHSVDQTCV
jgi:hypothetical protein